MIGETAQNTPRFYKTILLHTSGPGRRRTSQPRAVPTLIPTHLIIIPTISQAASQPH